MTTMPTRIDGDLFNSAKVAGEIESRSAAQQLDHWARIGRELESSPAITRAAIVRVLAGSSSYDDLSDRAQAVVRAAWSEEITTRISALDYEERFHESGQSWAESDAEGNVVVRGATAEPA